MKAVTLAPRPVANPPPMIAAAPPEDSIDSALDALVIVDRTTRTILAVNDEAEVLFGYRHEELYNVPLALLLSGSVGRRKGGAEFRASMSESRTAIGRASVAIISVRDEGARSNCERRYKLLFEASPLATWILDIDTGTFLAVNDAALRQYGYTREEFAALTINDLRVPSGSTVLGGAMQPEGAESVAPAGHRHHRRKDGSVFAVHIRNERTTFGERPALLSLVLDVARESATDKLTLRERQLAAAQALAHVGSWEADLVSGHVEWSDEIYRIYDLPIGSPPTFDAFIACVHPDDRARVLSTVSDALAGRVPAFELEYRLLRANGDVRIIQNRHVITFDAAAGPTRMIGKVLDLTDVRRSEQAVVASERHHREMIENASDIVTVLDPAGVILYTSPSVRRLLGYYPADLVGNDVLSFVHPDDRPKVLEAHLRGLAEPGTTNLVEFRFRHTSGAWRTLEALGQARMSDNSAPTVVVNSRDVTERALAREQQQALVGELHDARLAAESATRAKSAFLASMSHEIRTPMNAVLGLTELVLDSTLTAEQRRHLEMVQQSGDQLLALLNDILDLSKIESEHLELDVVPFDLAALIHTTVSFVAVDARDRDVELLVDIASEVPRFVSGDPTRLRQVFSNLLGNAVKFTAHGEIVASARIAASAHVVDPADGAVTVRLAVRDTGIGIPADKLETVFKDFSQVDASTTRAYGGTGLGLAIARRLVRLMGGELSVTSELGHGSEFNFTLRLPVAPAPAVSGSAAPVTLTGIRALVVDDNATNRGIVKEILVQAGAAVDEAPDAATALTEHTHALTTGAPYHIAVLDSQMPGHDGWSLATSLRGHAAVPRTHLLMLASSTERGDTERCRELGIDGYMLKPVSRVDLLEAIASVLSGRGEHGTPVTRNAMAEARVRLRILVAEDSAVNQEVVAAMLRKRGHLVTLVDDGAKAVAAAARELFDVVLMDIHMPVMDGLVATAAIRRLPAGTLLPIIALTADALAGEREHCLAAGMSGYLSKPFKSHELFAMVEGWGATQIPDTSGPSARQAPPVDVDRFRTTMREAGAEEAVDSILDAFLADAPTRLSAVVDAIAGGVASEIASAAHAFKSSAGVVGAGVLAGQLLAIELAGHEARVSAARAIVTDMHAEAAAVIAQLAARKGAVPGD